MLVTDRLGTLEDAIKLGLSKEEFSKIQELLGRSPSFTELAMFSGMWSEHCSYKNSKKLLKNLYAESPKLLAKPGEENAGVLKISDTLAIVFKIESHNHPSAIEPYQGALTGVGGIMRDVFTMGARPVVSLNSLRFGHPDQKRNLWLLKNVVRGIADYGNSLGIACAGGEVFFHDSYTQNPLVNAMSVGIVEIEKLTSARKGFKENLVIYAGARTGRDGIHGASFASKEISLNHSEERSAVQVGDPFLEKLLMEATLECVQKNLVTAMQDMGAAGLVSSTSEMSSSGGFGMVIDLEKIPVREENLEPFEYILSESQERMLILASPQNTPKILEIFKKWELTAAVIGYTIPEKELIFRLNGKIYAQLSPDFLTKHAPVYERSFKKPAKNFWEKYPPKTKITFNLDNILEAKDNFSLQNFFQILLQDPNFTSVEAIYEQYDSEVGLGRLIGPGQNGAVYRIGDGPLALAVTVDGNGFYVAQDPYLGAKHTVAEAFRNISATGAEALGITNCLNFANPYKEENFYYFYYAVQGMSDAARELGIPITGGNVSFYNESPEGPVLPTPTIGMVGILENEENALPAHFSEGSEVAILGFFKPELRGSYYSYLKTGSFSQSLPELDLKNEKKVAEKLILLNKKGLLLSAIDLSLGGLFMAFLRSLFAGRKKSQKKLGFTFFELNKLKQEFLSYENLFFGETAATYLISYLPTQKEVIGKEFEGEIFFHPLGKVTLDDKIAIEGIEISVAKLEVPFYETMRRYLK